MKKMTFVSLVLATLMALGLCSCSDQTATPSDPVTLSLWHVYGEQADAPMNRLVEEFNATVGQEKGVLVTVTNVTSTSKIGAQLLDSQAGSPGAPAMPDLFSCHTNNADALGVENLVDWSAYFSQEELNGYVPAFIQDGTMDGRFVIFPVSKSSYALFLNGSQFQRFSADTGVTYDALSTWDGFFDAAEKYYAWSGGKTFCAMDYLIRHVELDMLAKDGDFQYTEDGWYDVESQSFKDSWMMFAKPLAQGHIAVADLYANTQVMTGETLAGIGSTAAVTYYNDVVTYPDNTSEPTNLHVLPLPRSGDGQQYMPQTGVGLAGFYTTDEKAEAAAVFVRWFTESQRNLDFVAQTGYMPVTNGAFDAISDYSFSDQGYESLYSAIQTMHAEYLPVVRPTFGGFYDKTDALYAGLREMQGSLSARADSGESIDTLTQEIWDFFLSIK